MTSEEKTKILRDAIDTESSKPGVREMMEIYENFQSLQCISPVFSVEDEGLYINSSNSTIVFV